MKAELEKEESRREEAITRSRVIIRLSKQVIYALHRGEIKDAQGLADEMNKKVAELKRYKDQKGMVHVAFQEYVEAKAYLHFIAKRELISKKRCGVATEDYLLGLCDLTGELMRKAVNSIIADDEKTVHEIYALVSDIYTQFLAFDFRNSELRKKSDSIKWNLTKIEDLIYKIKMRDDAREEHDHD